MTSDNEKAEFRSEKVEKFEKPIEKFEKPIEKFEKPKKIVNKLELTLNDNQGLYNGKPINMIPSPYVRDGHIWLPYDLVCEFFNETMNVKDGILTIERSI